YSLDTTSWIAWQFHRADLNEGVVQAFRRPEAANETLTVRLRGLDPKQRYEIEDLDGGKEVRTGEELMHGLAITLREKPAAAVFTLKAIP
ncbi:MAG: GH36 C-terminal domain-containing protein, partial [Verrucomicrobiae bacterium]|nr:GH36 C-terminal domain-containing protein [Verrucomicrobiae bacterium]